MHAPEDLAKRVESLLVVLDQPGEQVERSVRLIKVGDAAEVARLQPLVEQLYTDHYKGNEQEPADAQVVADPISGNLIVSGRPTHLELIGVTGQGFAGDGNDGASEQIAGVGTHHGSRGDDCAEPGVQQ